jgi:UDP-N-acetylmuramoyl-L-alanyl-D-glutamate--2,6-diaminopimelate ligase
MDLSDLIAGLKVRTVGGGAPGPVRVCDITDDSRTAVTGSLFVARTGLQSDGRKFIPDALKSGAVAVLTDDPAVRLPSSAAALLISDDLPLVAAEMAERFYGTPTARLELVGITGTNGKTTTAHLVHDMLNGAGVRCGLIGTVLIDDGREVSRADMTTPPAIELSRTFATMVESGCKAAAMEVSSHALDQGRVAALRFDIGVFTNLTGDHLDYHKTMEAYAAAKARLFEMLPGDGCAIVNAEDRYAEQMAKGCRAKVLRCRVTEGEGAAQKADECVACIREMTMAGGEN